MKTSFVSDKMLVQFARVSGQFMLIASSQVCLIGARESNLFQVREWNVVLNIAQSQIQDQQAVIGESIGEIVGNFFMAALKFRLISREAFSNCDFVLIEWLGYLQKRQLVFAVAEGHVPCSRRTFFLVSVQVKTPLVAPWINDIDFVSNSTFTFA